MNVEEVLQGIPLRSTIRADRTHHRLPCAGAVFLTMVSDNILMAQGLFRLLLWPVADQVRRAMPHRRTAGELARQVRLFRSGPAAGRSHRGAVACVAGICIRSAADCREVVFDVDAPPATYQILEGEVRLESPDQAPILVSPGATFGVADTLAGTPFRGGERSRLRTGGRSGSNATTCSL